MNVRVFPVALGAIALLCTTPGCSWFLPKRARYCCRPSCGEDLRLIRSQHKNPNITYHCPWEMSLGVTGGGVRRVGASQSAYAAHVGAEVTLAKRFRKVATSAWLSAGSRFEGSRRDPKYAGSSYLEAGTTLAFFVFGAGGGVRYTADTVQAGPQLFVGFAWYVSTRPFLYVEPYYRVSFLFDVDRELGTLYMHEFGLQFRIATQRGMYLTCAKGPHP